MGFRNPLVGGVTLIRAAIQSNPYVTGVSGWSINRDGSAEFNNGVFRGSLGVGTAPGARFLVNPGNGDVLDVYDANNLLIANIDSTGIYTVYQYDNITHASIQHTEFGQQGLVYFSDVDASGALMEFASSAAGAPATQAVWTVQVANNNPGAHFEVYTLQVFAGSDDASKQPTMTGTERGHTGSIVQSDQVSTGNLIHPGAVSGTTDASGFLTFNHGAAFTPTAILTQAHGAGTPSFGKATVIDGSITSTQAKVLCTNLNGTTRTSAAVTFWIWCVG